MVDYIRRRSRFIMTSLNGELGVRKDNSDMLIGQRNDGNMKQTNFTGDKCPIFHEFLDLSS